MGLIVEIIGVGIVRCPDGLATLLTACHTYSKTVTAILQYELKKNSSSYNVAKANAFLDASGKWT